MVMNTRYIYFEQNCFWPQKMVNSDEIHFKFYLNVSDGGMVPDNIELTIYSGAGCDGHTIINAIISASISTENCKNEKIGSVEDAIAKNLTIKSTLSQKCIDFLNSHTNDDSLTMQLSGKHKFCPNYLVIKLANEARWSITFPYQPSTESIKMPFGNLIYVGKCLSTI